MNDIKIHVNRKFHINLSDIILVKHKKNKVYVKYYDKKKKITLYAIYKGELANILTAINTPLIMRQMPLIPVVEE
jgi:hypothetical protein